jgi:hypothetical protein
MCKTSWENELMHMKFFYRDNEKRENKERENFHNI